MATPFLSHSGKRGPDSHEIVSTPVLAYPVTAKFATLAKIAGDYNKHNATKGLRAGLRA